MSTSAKQGEVLIRLLFASHSLSVLNSVDAAVCVLGTCEPRSYSNERFSVCSGFEIAAFCAHVRIKVTNKYRREGVMLTPTTIQLYSIAHA